MWHRLVCHVAIVFALAASAAAQTPAFRLQWNTPDAAAAANGYAYTLRIDAASPIALAGVSCAGTPTVCSAPLPTLSTGAHTLVLTVFGNGASISSDPLTTSPPGKPISISVTVTINIP